MKRIGLKAILIGSGLAALAGAHFAPSLWEVKRTALQSLPPAWRTPYLRLTVSPSKTRLLVMEPLFIQVRLENTSRMDLQLRSIAGVRVQVLRPNENRWMDWMDPPDMLRAMIPNICQSHIYPASHPTVPAGQTVGTLLEIYKILEPRKGELQYALNEPGRYVVRVDFTVGPGPNPSKSFDEFTIEVDEPRDDDRAALDFLKSKNSKGNLVSLEPSIPSPQDLHDFLEKFHGSVYAPYAAYTCAMSLPRDRMADKLTILNLLVRGASRTFPPWVEAAVTLIRAHRERGDIEAEQELRAWIQEHMPEEYLKGRRYHQDWRWLHAGRPTFKQG